MGAEYMESVLTSESSKKLYARLPIETRIQLIAERDPHGNVQVSLIETEKLFGQMVIKELERRKKVGTYKGKFNLRFHFCGYQGRSAFPSIFDSQYCYALGHTAVGLISKKKTGYISCVKNLSKPVSEWHACGIPLTGLMQIEERHGQPKPVITKFLVKLDSKKFLDFAKNRERWKLQDAYRYPGPIQFASTPAVIEQTNFHLKSLL